MSRTFTIAKREVTSLFYSPIAYIVLAFFLLFMGIFFAVMIFVPGQITELRRLIDLSRFAFFFLVPTLTMHLFANEYNSGRIEMLRTSPISEFQLLMGKFFGAMGFFLVLVAATFVFLILLMIYGQPNFGQVIASYTGMILMGCMFVSIGLFYSACTQHQIVAWLAGILTLAAFTMLSWFAPMMPATIPIFKLNLPLRSVANYLSVGQHLADFSKGTIQTSHVAYFLGFTALFLFLTYLLLESRKWR